MIDTSLCDQRVSEARFAPLGEDRRSQAAGTLPEAISKFEQRQAGKRLREVGIQLGIAQQFSENHGRHDDQLVG